MSAGTGTTLQFVERGRTYTCRVDQPGAAAATRWWWVDVSGDGARYAPFRAEDGDTEASVRERVVAYYELLLERRATPVGWWTRSRDARAARERIAKQTA